MRVLLTGANGLLGSHILDALCESGAQARIFIRRTSDTAFIRGRLQQVEVCYGSLTDPGALGAAMADIEYVIHCAGKTKAIGMSEFYMVNRDGARYVADAASDAGSVKHLVHISSRAVLGPSRSQAPATEDDPPGPVSEYGRSKLAGEQEVITRAKIPYTILRPSAIYGPRDVEFLRMFHMVKRRLMPLLESGKQELSLAYVRDVADAALRVMGAPEAAGRIYNVASPEVCTSRDILEEIARQLRLRPLRIPLPVGVIYPVCVLQEFISRLTHRPNILGREKYKEIKAAGWVCSTERLKRELGFVCRTSLSEGVALSLDWYGRHGWV